MSEVPEALSAALAGRYTIERKLGAGGMATVYLARDPKHNRLVAVKVLRPELTASLGSERFLKEIEISARFTHPHIVPLHDSGEADGLLYYVMPFIDGGSLRTLLIEERRLASTAALDITIKVADALSYAHHQGVVHRDIKPENILFSGRHPMVADFGIARAVSTAGGVELTRTGFPLGTPGYMSPEQAAGLRELDERTDVYSLACVCYEMLVGETPGMWLTDAAVKRGRFIDASPTHRAVLDRLTSSIEAALVQALAISPDARFPSAEALVGALIGNEVARRQYRDDEVQAIVRRASEVQAAHPTEDAGLTIGTVREIAGNVGISAERVDRAARELELKQPEDPPAAFGPAEAFLGSPTRLEFDRTIDGEVPSTAYEELVEEIQMAVGSVGQIGTLGRSLMWSTAHSGPGVDRAVQVRVTSKAGRTHIHVQERIGEVAGTVFGGIMGGGGGGGTGIIVGVGIGALGAGAAVIPIVAAWVGGLYFLARKIFKSLVHRRKQELEALADRLASVARDAAQPKPGPNPERALPE